MIGRFRIAAGAVGIFAGLVVAVTSTGPLTSDAEAARSLAVGFADDKFADNLFTNASKEVRRRWLSRASAVNAEFVRINVYWSNVARTKPASPADPGDPAYDWSEIDRAVDSAVEQDLKPILLVLNAPAWAEGANRPSPGKARAGTWMPDAEALGRFGTAISSRYAGRVRHYEAWNEPNLVTYVAPQWRNKEPRSPEIYRTMLASFYDGVKATSSRNQVITGGTSPFGEPPGGRKMHPLYFWRKVFCLKGRNLKRTAGCKGDSKPSFDIFGTNAINGVGDMPNVHARHPDDVTPADFGSVRRLVRAAERRNTVGGGKRHGLWSTETWYESRPPDPKGLPLKKQAKAMTKSLHILWKQGADAVIFLQLRDSSFDPKTPSLIGFQTGIYFRNERPKPSLRAVRFPFVAERQSARKVRVWGKAPRPGRVVIQRQRGRGWQRVARLRTRSNVFNEKLNIPGGAKLRAVAGGTASPSWKP